MFLTGDTTFASLGVATIIVVAIAVLGSLTVLPALLSRLGDSVDRLRVPLVGRLRRDDGEGRFWGAIVDRVLRRPVLLGRPRRRPAARARRSRRSSSSWRRRGPDTFPQSLPVDADLQPDAAGVPRHGAAGERRRQGAERERTGRARGDRRGSSSGRSRAAACTSRSPSTSTATAPSRTSPIPIDGKRNRRRVERGARRSCATRSCPQTVGALPNAEAGVTGLTAAVEGLHRPR